MPALPVVQMSRAVTAGLARMAELAVAEAVGADAHLVLIRQNAHRRGVTRRGRRSRRTPMRREIARKNGDFRGILGVFGGGWGGRKSPPGWVLPCESRP